MLNRNFFFTELQKVHGEIAHDESVSVEEGFKSIGNTIDVVSHFSKVARKEGLLALEEEINKKNEDGSYVHNDFVRLSATYVVDGADPELVEEFMLSKYISDRYHCYEALRALIVIRGVLAIQAGENPHVIDAQLLSMIPSEVINRYYHGVNSEIGYYVSDNGVLKAEEDKTPEEKNAEETAMEEAVKRACEKTSFTKEGDPEYFLVKLMDYILGYSTDTMDDDLASAHENRKLGRDNFVLDDRFVQRLLRDVPGNTLVYVLCSVTGSTRRRIFDNLPLRVSFGYAEDMERAYLTHERVATSCREVAETFMRLHNSGEIVGNFTPVVHALSDVFLSGYEELRKGKKKRIDKVKEAEKLLDEYRKV